MSGTSGGADASFLTSLGIELNLIKSFCSKKSILSNNPKDDLNRCTYQSLWVSTESKQDINTSFVIIHHGNVQWSNT